MNDERRQFLDSIDLTDRKGSIIFKLKMRFNVTIDDNILDILLTDLETKSAILDMVAFSSTEKFYFKPGRKLTTNQPTHYAVFYEAVTAFAKQNKKIKITEGSPGTITKIEVIS